MREARQRCYRLAVAFALFERVGVKPRGDADPRTDESDPTEREIRCPACAWHPDASSLWYCYQCDQPEQFFGGCGTEWNTFDTHGVCPGCGHVWRWTACLACGQWSLHDEWYAIDPTG